ncbi:hypothetical protein ACTFIV_010713 [Dictyostelium citrinum]
MENEKKKINNKISQAIVTCPVHFNGAQRAAIRDAGEIAGLDVVRVLDEPRAAAFSYDKGEEKNLLVYDLGGSKFDVSIISLENGYYEILANKGDTHLGGEDFDQNIMKHLLSNFKKKTGKDASTDIKSLQKLRKASENAKHTLSTTSQATIEIENFFALVIKVLEDSKLKKSQIHEIVLVGGSTSIPKIQQILKDFFDGKEPNRSILSDEVVAYGAAVQEIRSQINYVRDDRNKRVIEFDEGLEMTIFKNYNLSCNDIKIITSSNDDSFSNPKFSSPFSYQIHFN